MICGLGQTDQTSRLHKPMPDRGGMHLDPDYLNIKQKFSLNYSNL